MRSCGFVGGEDRKLQKPSSVLYDSRDRGQQGFIRELKSWLGLDPDAATAEGEVNETNPLFVYVKIPAALQPLERGELFEDPLQAILEKEKAGTVTGGGSQLSNPDENGYRSIEYCGIDIDLYDPTKGLALLRAELVRLNAPTGTMLLYELNGKGLEELIYQNG